MNADNPGSNPIILRILRSPNGASRTAIPGEPGLLAYGSDAPADAAVLARDIGITARQLIEPNQSLWLPIRLHMPFPVDGAQDCHPNGESIDRGRKVLVLSCALDQDASTDRLQATIHLTGQQEVDVATGVRLSGEMNGWMSGRARATARSPWQPADATVSYSKETEFD